MPVVESRSVLTRISVAEVMRRQVVRLPQTVEIAKAIRLMAWTNISKSCRLSKTF